MKAVAAFARQNTLPAAVMDAMEQPWTVFVEYVRFSYWVEGGGAAERGAAKAAGEIEGAGVRSVRELPRGGQVKLLENGRLAICRS